MPILKPSGSVHQREFAAAAQKDTSNFCVWAKVNSQPAWLLIDSDCTGNFMDSEFAAKHAIWTQVKKNPFRLQGFDGTFMKHNDEWVNRETVPTPMRLGQHLEKIQFDITEQPGSDIVLGIPWLWAANPMIDWAENKIYFVKSSNSNKLYSVLNSPEGVKIFAMSAEETREELKNPDTKILWSRWVKDDWDPVTKIFIPKEYKDFEELFTAVKDQDTLLKHQEWDHEIKIMKGCMSTKQPIYSLSPQKLDAL